MMTKLSGYFKQSKTNWYVSEITVMHAVQFWVSVSERLIVILTSFLLLLFFNANGNANKKKQKKECKPKKKQWKNTILLDFRKEYALEFLLNRLCHTHNYFLAFFGALCNGTWDCFLFFFVECLLLFKSKSNNDKTSAAYEIKVKCISHFKYGLY